MPPLDLAHDPAHTANRPDPNTYWVQVGKLLAGEYPGDRDPSRTRTRLERWLQAGIRSFVDLTEAHELEPYHALVDELASTHSLEIRYRRLPIRDMGVPGAEHMAQILAHIRAEIAAGRPTYVHCWGGIGRTGTVVGCWLVRAGHPPDQALQQLHARWTTVAKFARRPQSPETPEQRKFVELWPSRDPGAAA